MEVPEQQLSPPEPAAPSFLDWLEHEADRLNDEAKEQENAGRRHRGASFNCD